MKNAQILAGDTFKTNEGGIVKVLIFEGCYSVRVQHLDSAGHVATVTASQLRSGRIKNPYRPRIYGVGFAGFGDHKPSKDGKDTKEYVAWTKMLHRCYGEKAAISNPSYKGCYVAPEWHDFQAFAEWYSLQEFKGSGYQLDKDILIKGNREYSSNFCRLVPEKINKLLTGSDSRRGKHPIGVNFYAGKFCAHCSTDGNKNHIGRFDTAELAFYAYKKFRESYVKRRAEDYRLHMPKEIYEALIAWSVDIDD